MLAINKRGLYFLSQNDHKILLYFKFNEIISTRRYRADNNAQFVDLKTGNLMLQKVTKIETEHVSFFLLGSQIKLKLILNEIKGQ